MTNQDILRIAMAQSAIDLNCNPDDFYRSDNLVVESANHPEARKYLELPFYCNFVSYGNNIVASVNREIQSVVQHYIERYKSYQCFETPGIHVLNDELQKRNMRICFMAEYFLPDVQALKPIECQYELKVLLPEHFTDLYTPQWSNALCEKRKHLDVLAIGAYDGSKLIGLAGCSADCETMWQIGVDVLAEYRRQGIAAALTSRLALAVPERGKIPFYCAAWSNIKSVRNAITSGFRPAWIEMTAKSIDFVESFNE